MLISGVCIFSGYSSGLASKEIYPSSDSSVWAMAVLRLPLPFFFHDCFLVCFLDMFSPLAVALALALAVALAIALAVALALAVGLPLVVALALL